MACMQFLREEGGVNFDALRMPYWTAPEVLKHGHHTTASDVYAFGMMMYEVLFKREHFPGETAEVSRLAEMCSRILLHAHSLC